MAPRLPRATEPVTAGVQYQVAPRASFDGVYVGPYLIGARRHHSLTDVDSLTAFVSVVRTYLHDPHRT